MSLCYEEITTVRKITTLHKFFMQCKNEIFEPDPTKMRILLFLFMKTYLGLSDHDDRFFNNIVSKNETNSFSFSILLEERISNCDSDHGLLIYSNEAIEYMWRLYDLLVEQEPSLDVVTEHPAVKSTLIIIWNHKSIQYVSRTGKWVQCMEFVSINKMFICAKETSTFGILIWENLSFSCCSW